MSDYNGYTNWATWNVNLWIANDEGLYLAHREYADRWSKEMAKQFCNEFMPNGTPDFKGPADYSDVNFDELVDLWNYDIEENK